jgi:hypothetical protein
MSNYEVTEENGNPGLAAMAGGLWNNRIVNGKNDPDDWIKAAAGENPAAD